MGAAKSPVGRPCEQCGVECKSELDFLYYGSTKSTPEGDGVFRAIHSAPGMNGTPSCTDRWIEAHAQRQYERARSQARRLFTLFSYYYNLAQPESNGQKASEQMADMAERLIEYITTGKE